MDKSIYTAEYRKLCAVLKQLRLEAGLTQVQVAEALDEPQSFVSKYESGERRLDLIELRQVLRQLGSEILTVIRLLDQA